MRKREKKSQKNKNRTNKNRKNKSKNKRKNRQTRNKVPLRQLKTLIQIPLPSIEKLSHQLAKETRKYKSSLKLLSQPSNQNRSRNPLMNDPHKH